jgi:hypothetical protein
VRRAVLTAVRLVELLKPAVRSLDLAGLSWRQLRGFQRGASCLSRCDEGHTYGPWCQLGFPLPGPSYLLAALAEVTMPLPEAPQRLHDETIRAIHEALTQVAELPAEPLMTDLRLTRLPRPPELEPVTCGDLLSACTHDGPHVPVGTDGRPVDCQAAECFGMACMTECATSHRLERYLADTVQRLAEHPLVESVHLVHTPGCASIPDVEGKAGPCDCGIEAT